jgi:hypothetical protein
MKSLKKKKIIKVSGFLMSIYKNRSVITGGEIQSVFNLVKKFDPKIKKILGKKYPLSPSVNINKLKKIIK